MLTSVTAPAGTGLSTSYTYFNNTDTQNWERLKTIQNMTGTIQLSKFDYTYNAVGTIASWTTQSGTTTAIVNTLSYDNADQLTKNVQSGGATAGNGYNYDPAGNRLAELTLSGTTVTATTASLFNNLNQLTSTGTGTNTTVSGTTNIGASTLTVNGTMAAISGTINFTAAVPTLTGTNVLSILAKPSNGGAPATQRFGITLTGTTPTALSYDLNGNTTTDERGYLYKWDALNRLTAIIYPTGPNAGTHTEFRYDGLSHRTGILELTGTITGSGTVTSMKNYLWVGSEIAEERDGSNAVQKRFFSQGEQQSGINYYYTRDHLGSVRELLNSSGTIVARYGYDMYGKTTLISGSNLATKQYAGMYMHQQSGMYLTRAGSSGSTGRAYDSNLGRWLSRDPSSEQGGLNLYEYVDNDPVEFTDRLGLSKCTDFAHILVQIVQEGGTTLSALAMASETNYAHNKKWQCDCFLPWLTQGHQGGEVYAHVLGHVAAILAGLTSLSDGQLKQDQDEYARAKAGKGGHAPEKEAEILDDVAARQVAQVLQQMDQGRISPAAAEAAIKALLCDPNCGP